jgi:predicted  nucleic acid-binding Zn-ribbon protein
MTEEELRARIVELEEIEKKLTQDLEDANKKYDELKQNVDTEKEMLESRIADLKEYNKELFLKVSNKVDDNKQKPQPESTTSIEDVINSFK